MYSEGEGSYRIFYILYVTSGPRYRAAFVMAAPPSKLPSFSTDRLNARVCRLDIATGAVHSMVAILLDIRRTLR